VVLAALEPLVSRVEPETWPAGYPDELKGFEGQGVIHDEDGTALVVRDGGRRVTWRFEKPERADA